jgi:hypothetical protein
MLARRLAQYCMSTLVQDDENILQHVWSYKLYVSDSIYSFGADQGIFPILSWGKASNQVGNTSPLLRGLSFLLLGCPNPLVYVTKSNIPDLEIDRKIMKYTERYKMATLFLY